jgi:hypothetical protein
MKAGLSKLAYLYNFSKDREMWEEPAVDGKNSFRASEHWNMLPALGRQIGRRLIIC